MEHLRHLNNLKSIFLKSVEAVKPKNLLSAGNGYNLVPSLESGRTYIQLEGKNVDITNKKCHVVGFGKAVLGMAVQLERSLDSFLVKGLISIPKGTQQQFEGIGEMSLKRNSVIQIFEGAENNQPDEDALKAAKEIMKLAQSMTQEDILFVLISGGGSALLPLPKSLLKLENKMLLIKRLSNAGASIQEMNIVRIAMSQIKGGQLAWASSKAHAIISFVISDIVGDPLDLIASGPTWSGQTKRPKAEDILNKYNLWHNLNNDLRTELSNEDIVQKPLENNSIYVVGNNRVATSAAVQASLELHYNPFVVSTSIQGDVKSLVPLYRDLLINVYKFKGGHLTEEEFSKNFPFDSSIFPELIKAIKTPEETQKPLLLILAGEPTVKVSGEGKGGRNQELALRLSQELYNEPLLRNACFLSAGTDGIDGPCLAAGAMGHSLVVSEFLEANSQNLTKFSEFLKNNDSYHFYNQLKEGAYHVVTGHTGTNVMDLHFILVL